MDAEQVLKRYADGRRDLSWADLRGVDLVGASLPGINLYRADLTGAVLERADLRGANLMKANLSQANLSQADLTGANLRRADLTGTVLTEAILDAVRFSDVVLPYGIPSVSPSKRQVVQLLTSSSQLPIEPEASQHHSLQHHPSHYQHPSTQSAKKIRSRRHQVSLPSFQSSPSLTELPVPTLALLWSGYCCFGGILGIHDVPHLLWLMVWSTALAWMLGESMAWFTPVLAAIAVMLGSGISLWALTFAGSVTLGLGAGLLLLGWSLPKALKDSLWIGGLVVILINLTLWLVQSNGRSLTISGYFPLAFLLVLGMATSGMGAIAWLQMHRDGFKRKHIAWTFAGCAALGLLCGGWISHLLLPAL